MTGPFKKTHVNLAIACSLLASTGLFNQVHAKPEALESSFGAEADTIETITVSATRTEREINEIAANVTRIKAEDIDAISTNNIRDLFRYEPGVAVEGSGRFGLSNINIRGINGDRVLILLDKVPVADEFSFGPNLSSRRDFVDVDLIKSAEVIRGPVSTLYGSDAIGGVVAFTSKDPMDFVEDGESLAGRVKLGYVSQSNERYVNAQLAGVSGDWQWLLNGGLRDSEQTETFFDTDVVGGQQQSANPQSADANNALLKLIWSPDSTQRLSFIAETFEASAETNVTSDIGTMVFGFVNTDSRGDDRRKRDRLSLHYQYQPEHIHWTQDWGLHRFTIDAFTQSSDTFQHTDIQRTSLEDPNRAFSRSRDSQFEQAAHGILTQADFQFSGAGEHYLIAGIEWQQTDSESLREGATVDAQSGALLPEFSVFPTRDFPISRLTEFAVFVQDEWQLFDGKLTLSPGLRYDTFKLEPESDAIFSSANMGVEVADFSDSELTGKVGAVFNLSSDSSIWAQWAQGFRIPPMDDVNIGFTNFAGGYTSLANPDLMPESVDSIELGWRQSFEQLSFSISAYQNEYENFIESLAVRGFNPQTNLMEFQARNIEDVEISGVDVSASYEYEQWQVRLATSMQNSENKATGSDLDSVLPAQTVLGLSYGRLDDPWRVEVVGTYISEANALASAADEPANFVAPSATLIDVLAHLQINDNIRINAGIFNVSNEQYWFASEVRGRSVTENLDRLTSPGINASANVIVTF